jgi:hypothetical protein
MTTPDLSPAPRHLLRVQAGPNAGHEYPIQPGKVILGRDPANDIVLEDDSVSPRHARLDHNDGAWRLTDLCSTNGTRVDGERIPEDTPTPLPEGTEFALGGVKLLLDVREEPEEAAGTEEEAMMGAAEPASTPGGPAPGSGVHAPVSGGEGRGTTPARRMKLPLWAVVLAILIIVVVAIVLIAAAPAEIVTAEAALFIDNVLLPPAAVS